MKLIFHIKKNKISDKIKLKIGDKYKSFKLIELIIRESDACRIVNKKTSRIINLKLLFYKIIFNK